MQWGIKVYLDKNLAKKSVYGLAASHYLSWLPLWISTWVVWGVSFFLPDPIEAFSKLLDASTDAVTQMVNGFTPGWVKFTFLPASGPGMTATVDVRIDKDLLQKRVVADALDLIDIPGVPDVIEDPLITRTVIKTMDTFRQKLMSGVGTLRTYTPDFLMVEIYESKDSTATAQSIQQAA